VIIDEDRADCQALKQVLEKEAHDAGLLTRTAAAGQPYQVLNRIAIEELEAWFFGDVEVQSKARAAAKWCRYATEHEVAHGGKPWSYVLIPHDAIDASATLKSLAALHAYQGAENDQVSPPAPTST
jgi:hypothetical protein